MNFNNSKYFSNGLFVFSALWLVAFFSLMPNPIQTFLQGYPYVLVGFMGAVIGNLTALGGGLVFIPVLIFFGHVPPSCFAVVAILDGVLFLTQ
jgi:hypothetical protein